MYGLSDERRDGSISGGAVIAVVAVLAVRAVFAVLAVLRRWLGG